MVTKSDGRFLHRFMREFIKHLGILENIFQLSDKALIFVQLLSENTDFTVIGVLGAPGVGKSTIMNELYGFDSISPGPFLIINHMLPLHA